MRVKGTKEIVRGGLSGVRVTVKGEASKGVRNLEPR